MTETIAKIVADSISADGFRLTTFECTFPRIILAEVNTHKMLSKNSASSRAIPVERMIQRVLEDPYVPTHWGKNQKGMRAEQDVDEAAADAAASAWKAARGQAVLWTKTLLDLGIHKQITNRLIEPFMWHTAVLSGTEWSNFFNLRDTKDAHPDFRDLAHCMRELYAKGEPSPVNYGDWHLPYVSGSESFDAEVLHDADYACRIAIGRCARVSYDRLHEEETPEKSKARCDGMLAAGHMSPFGHVARPMTLDELDLFKQKKLRWDAERREWFWVGAEWSDGRRHVNESWNGNRTPNWSLNKEGEYTHFLGPVNGWVQYRKLIPHEEDILGARA